MKKELVVNFVIAITSALTLTGLGATVAKADGYYSPAPTPPPVPKPTDSWYITTSDKGIQFYGVTPFFSEQTNDRNLFVSGMVMMKGQDVVHGSYVLIDCGRLRYRDIMPWFIINANGNQYSEEPTSYDWRYFRTNSVFEIVGRKYCEEAARQRGFDWVWYR